MRRMKKWSFQQKRRFMLTWCPKSPAKWLLLFMGLPIPCQALDTVLSYYRPFPETKLSQQGLSGFCDSPSILVSREDAWRCQVKDKTYDPCFVSYEQNRKMAYCPEVPWSKGGIFITVVADLAPHQHSIDMSRGYPWVIRLEHDIICHAIATTEKIQNLSIRYQCQDGSYLLGHIQRCTPKWQMLQEKASKIEKASLVNVWF